MNTVQLEQVIMSSFSTSSTLRTTGSPLHEYPYTFRPFHQKQVSSTEKIRRTWSSCGSWLSSYALVAISLKDAPGRIRTLFFATVSKSFQDHTNKLVMNIDTRGDYYCGFCFP